MTSALRDTSLQVVAAVYVEGEDLHRSCCDCLCSPCQVRRRLPNRRLREGGQLSRLCAVADPLVEVVYVSPCVLPETVMAYYRKMIEVGEVQLPLVCPTSTHGCCAPSDPLGRLCLRWFLVVARHRCPPEHLQWHGSRWWYPRTSVDSHPPCPCRRACCTLNRLSRSHPKALVVFPRAVISCSTVRSEVCTCVTAHQPSLNRYSPRALSKLRRIIGARRCYIVPHRVGPEDVRLGQVRECPS